MDAYLHFPPNGIAQLPSIILEQVFLLLPVKDILTSTQVCWSWKNLIDKTFFWLKRMKRNRIKLHLELEHVLLNHDAQDQVITCLKNACKYRFEICKIECSRDTGILYENFGELREFTDDYEVDGHFHNFDIMENWSVSEYNLAVASALLFFNEAKSVFVKLRQKHSEIPNLVLFTKILSFCNCEVIIEDIYSWRNADSTSAELLNILSAENKICKLAGKFQGAITSLKQLPSPLYQISLAIRPDQTSFDFISGLKSLISFKDNLPNDLVPPLCIHVIAGTNVSTLPPLPIVKRNGMGINRTYLFLSKVSESQISWAVETAQRLQSPGSSYYHVLFPESSLTPDNIDSLLESLAEARVKINKEIIIDSEDIDEEEVYDKILGYGSPPPYRLSFETSLRMQYFHGW